MFHMSYPHWEDFDEEPKPRTCGECGQKGWHHPNCTMGDGDAIGDDSDDDSGNQPRTP